MNLLAEIDAEAAEIQTEMDRLNGIMPPNTDIVAMMLRDGGHILWGLDGYELKRGDSAVPLSIEDVEHLPLAWIEGKGYWNTSTTTARKALSTGTLERWNRRERRSIYREVYNSMECEATDLFGDRIRALAKNRKWLAAAFELGRFFKFEWCVAGLRIAAGLDLVSPQKAIEFSGKVLSRIDSHPVYS